MQVIKEDGIVDGVMVYHTAMPSNTTESKKNKRVAAYCRVSTALEIQDSSLELQMETYHKIIEEHPGWTLARIYADKGISGTRATNRPEFIQMIEDARAGKIDVILAKSLSRFARNTIDTLQFTRELKQLGVTVYFEKEKIDTSSVASEFMLTIFAAFAQEESHSISENTKRGIRNKFKLGQPRYTKILGYDKDWHTNDDVWLVKKIFNLAFDGKSKRDIAHILNEEGIPTPEGNATWHHSTILGILRNEKYIGDVLMQKTFTGDYIKHNKVYNKNLIIDSYYKKNHHPAIVQRDLFDALKYETNLKRGKYGADQTPYYGILKCSECGRPMIKIPGIYSEKRPMWVCPGNDNTGTLDKRRTCDKFIVLSTEIDKVLKHAVKSMDTQYGFEEPIDSFNDLVQLTGEISYCRVFPLVKSMTICNKDTLRVCWKMGWSGEYKIVTVADVDRQWIAIAKAHIENVNVNGMMFHKVNHPFRVRKNESSNNKKH